jgi:hypothetical protein
MPSGTSTMDRSPERTGQWLSISVVATVLPALAYFATLTLGMFGILGPARWLFDALCGPLWFMPLFWLLVIGGPMLSAIGSLMLTERHGTRSRLERGCGWMAIGLLILNIVTCVPIPWFVFLLAGD